PWFASRRKKWFKRLPAEANDGVAGNVAVPLVVRSRLLRCPCSSPRRLSRLQLYGRNDGRRAQLTYVDYGQLRYDKHENDASRDGKGKKMTKGAAGSRP